MSAILTYLLARLREPSTMAGMAACAVAFGMDSERVHIAIQIVTGLAGFAAMFLPEKK